MGEKVLKRCLVLGGMVENISPKLKGANNPDTFVICADRGYKGAESLGIKPKLIVGDFDSAPMPGIDAEIIKLPTHKDDTDLHFAVKEGIKRGYNSFVLSGVTGGRLDHTLAAITTLNFLFENGIAGEICDKACKAFITDSRLTLSNPRNNCYLSVFPITESATVTIKGAEYSATDIKITSIFPIGVSNHFRDDSLELTVKDGRIIVLLINE